MHLDRLNSARRPARLHHSAAGTQRGTRVTVTWHKVMKEIQVKETAERSSLLIISFHPRLETVSSRNKMSASEHLL